MVRGSHDRSREPPIAPSYPNPLEPLQSKTVWGIEYDMDHHKHYRNFNIDYMDRTVHIFWNIASLEPEVFPMAQK